MPVAMITGASRGLGLALADALASRGWDLVLDARSPGPLQQAAARLNAAARRTGAQRTATQQTATQQTGAERTGVRVRALPGDIADSGHRAALVATATALGGLDLLVNNASALGAEPLVRLADLAPEGLRAALETNVVAPHALVRLTLPLLRAASGAVVNVSSDAAVEAYETWGGYGASKAALDQLSAVLAIEEPWLRVWWVDPGDLRTALYRAACPDDPDAEHRPEPRSVVPAFLRLLDERPDSGRYLASALRVGGR